MTVKKLMLRRSKSLISRRRKQFFSTRTLRKTLGEDASRLPAKSAVGVKGAHCVLEFKDSPIWEGSLCACCQKPLGGQRLK